MNSPAPVVYIVDDDNGMRTSLAWLLDSVGVKSEGFANAAEFLRAFDSESAEFEQRPPVVRDARHTA